MKRLDQLGISPTPWNMKTWQASDDYGTVVESSNHNTVCDCSWSALGDDQGEIDARIIAAAPDMYEALFDCCEEVNYEDAPRCYGFRRDRDGHCMARVFCAIYKALAKASGEEVAL